MKANVDQSGCIGCGMCEQTAPEVFQLNGGVAEVICGDVAPHNGEAAKEAAAQCPVQVIQIDG